MPERDAHDALLVRLWPPLALLPHVTSQQRGRRVPAQSLPAPDSAARQLAGVAPGQPEHLAVARLDPWQGGAPQGYARPHFCMTVQGHYGIDARPVPPRYL